MTLGVAWIRNIGTVRELIVASDSRLGAGAERWDACPKILTLPRTDAVISFAGVTELAYPAMLQVHRAIEVHPALRNRQFDITQVSSLVEDVLNQMVGLVKTDLPESLEHSLKNTEFLLAGFSWRLQSFRIWRFFWLARERRIVKARCLKQRGYSSSQIFRFVGGPAGEAKRALGAALTEAGKSPGVGGLDMEPLGVIERFVKDHAHRDVGGAPQVVKVYRHLNTEPFSVTWPRGEQGQQTFAGRPLLDYEKAFTPAIDLDKPEQHYARLQTSSGVISANVTDSEVRDS